MGDFISSVFAFLLSFISTRQVIVNNEANNQATILFAGDVMLGRSVMGEAIDGNNYLYPFEKVKTFLSNADITFVNLENAVIENCPRQYKGSFSFCTTPEIAKGLWESGVDIVSLANNHSGNFGIEGLDETKRHLNNLGIKWVDGTNLEIIEKAGTNFGFLGFNLVYRNLSEEDLKLIAESNNKVDVLIVSPHWGDEYKNMANKFQTETAKVMVELGADLIVGHHPHWVQNYEEYMSRPIYYSLGNFIFDQSWSEETKKGLLVKFTFDGKNIVNREEFNTYTPKIGQPMIQ